MDEITPDSWKRGRGPAAVPARCPFHKEGDAASGGGRPGRLDVKRKKEKTRKKSEILNENTTNSLECATR